MESTSDLPDDCSLALDEEEKESLALVSCNQVIINNMLTSKFVKYFFYFFHSHRKTLKMQ